MQMNITSLCFEVTRRCNMACEHCMRGGAQDLDIRLPLIDEALKSLGYIGELTITGGEPALNLPAIRYILNAVKRYRIPVYGFFIATNGKEVSDEFLKLLIDLDAYCLSCTGGDRDENYSAVALSLDEFHEEIPEENKYKLMALRSYSDMKQVNFFSSRRKLIDLGNAKNLSDWEKMDPLLDKRPDVTLENNSLYIDGTVVVTVDGDVLCDADYAYDMAKDIAIGSLATDSFFDIMARYAD